MIIVADKCYNQSGINISFLYFVLIVVHFYIPEGSNDVLMGDCVRHTDVMLSNFGWNFEHEKWFFVFEGPFYMQLQKLTDELNLEPCSCCFQK